MKKLIFLFIFWILLTHPALAECDRPCPPPDPCMKFHPMPCDRGEEIGMMMFCGMMKEQAELKTLLKSTLLLQQRSLKASAKEKAKIKTEIDALIKRLDAMPNKMDCSMMWMSQEGCLDRDVRQPNQPKENPPAPDRH